MQSLSENSKYGALLARTPSLRHSATRKPQCGWVASLTGKLAVRENFCTMLCVRSVEPSSATTTSNRPSIERCSASDARERSKCSGRSYVVRTTASSRLIGMFSVYHQQDCATGVELDSPRCGQELFDCVVQVIGQRALAGEPNSWPSFADSVTPAFLSRSVAIMPRQQAGGMYRNISFSGKRRFAGFYRRVGAKQLVIRVALVTFDERRYTPRRALAKCCLEGAR